MTRDRTGDLYRYDSMFDTVKPGDRVEVTGIYKASPQRVILQQRLTKSVLMSGGHSCFPSLSW